MEKPPSVLEKSMLIPYASLAQRGRNLSSSLMQTVAVMGRSAGMAMRAENAYKNDVLFWADLRPRKQGSFEDYVSALAAACAENRIGIRFVFSDDFAASLKFLLRNVSYDVFKNRSLKAVTDILENARPRVAHFNFFPFCSPSVLMTRMLGVKKLIFTDHCSSPALSAKPETNSFLVPWKHAKGRFYASYINEFIAVSEYVAERQKRDVGIPGRRSRSSRTALILRDSIRPSRNETP